MDRGAWWPAVHGVAKSPAGLSDFTFTFHFHALEKEMATHSSILAWRIPGTEEPSGLPSVGSHRVGHNWSDLAAGGAAVLFNDYSPSPRPPPQSLCIKLIPVPRLAPLHKTLHKHKTLKLVDFLWKLWFLRKFPFLPSFFNRDLASSEFMISSSLWMIFFSFLSWSCCCSSIFPLWFSHFYLGFPWFLRPSLCALSVFLITHYLSFCSSSGIGVAISKAFLWDLLDSIIKWIQGGVFVKMDPVCLFVCLFLPCPRTLIEFLKTKQDKNNQLIFLPVCKILLAIILHIDL